jgi:hypothetical protein
MPATSGMGKLGRYCLLGIVRGYARSLEKGEKRPLRRVGFGVTASNLFRHVSGEVGKRHAVMAANPDSFLRLYAGFQLQGIGCADAGRCFSDQSKRP